MFAFEQAQVTAGKMTARKEVRLHTRDAELISKAARAEGLQEADFIRSAALLRAQSVRQRLSQSVLEPEMFDAFVDSIDAPAKVIDGLAETAKSVKGLLRSE